MPLVGSSAFPSCGDIFSLIRACLNDADIPTVSIVSPTGAVRSSNQVTITTTTAHGLQINNIVSVLNVIDSSFDGMFQIDSVPSPTTFTYAQFAANASSGTGTIAQVVQGDVYTDTVLLPFVNSAYRKVQARLGQTGSKTSTSTVELTLPAGTTSLDDASNPQLPVDFMAPRIIQERISGQPFFGGEMRRLDVLPSYPRQTLNSVWCWQDEAILFPGALNDTDIRLRYFKGTLNVLTDATSQILIRGAGDAVAFYGSYLAAKSRGSTQVAILKGDFEEAMQELQNLQAHSRQYKPARRRSYGRTFFQNNGNFRGTSGSF